MSYEVIARRWRPQDFTGLIGQDHVRTTLLNALKAGRLHHALLFTGPRGTGKTSSARILAKALRCPNATNYVPCNQCSECQEIAEGRSLNVIEIDGASNNGVDAIRELRDTVGYMPSSGKHKLYIIDEVHMLSTSAFNALLKTLEEPPEHVYFVMATTEAHKIPNTILSRCQRFDFRRIPTRVIMQHLQTICERDGIQFEPDALWTIARQGDGSMRDAQSLLDQVINFTDANLKRDLVVATLGLTDRGLLLEILAALMGAQIESVIKGIAALHQSGGDPKLFLLDLMEQIRNALLLKLGSSRELIDLPDAEQEALLNMSAHLTPEDLHLLFDMTLKGAQDLTRANDPLLVLEMILMRITSAPRIADIHMTAVPTNLVARTGPEPRVTNTSAAPPARAETAHSSGPVNHAPTRTAMPAAPPPASATPSATAQPTPIAPNPNSPLDHRFKELVEKIKEVNGLIAAQLENCVATQLEHKVLTVAVSDKHKFLFDKINAPDFKKKVVNYINTFWGPGYTLNIVMGGTERQDTLSPKVLSEKQEQTRQMDIRAQVEAHPLVQSVQAQLKAEIKSIKDFPPKDTMRRQS